MGIVSNIVIVVLEIVGLYLSYKSVGKSMIIYYTEISNFLALVASVGYLLSGGSCNLLRYVSVCMLVMTFLISLFVLSPTAGGLRSIMFTGERLYHHTIIPILSFLSYLFFERHCGIWYVPVILSMAYGFLMIYLNHIGKMEGPYDFFRIDKNGKKATLIWVIVLMVVISSISLGVDHLSDLFE